MEMLAGEMTQFVVLLVVGIGLVLVLRH